MYSSKKYFVRNSSRLARLKVQCVHAKQSRVSNMKKLPVEKLVLLFALTLNEVVHSYVHHHKTTLTTNHQHHKIVETIGPHEEENFTPALKQPKPYRSICINEEAICVLPVQCPAHFYDEKTESCTSVEGNPGICCTTGQNHTGPLQEKDRHNHVTNIDSDTLSSLTRHSRVEVAEMHMREARLLSSGHSALNNKASASYGHYRNSRLFSLSDLTEVITTGSKAMEIAIATRTYKHRQGISNKQIELGMIKQNLKHSPLGGACAHPPICPPIPNFYRRISGACNNLLYPLWGARLSPYNRLLPPSYQDGIWSPRVSKVHGQPLPSPRLISSVLMPDYDAPNYNNTLMTMQFGQYLAHEITQSIDMSFGNGSAISCCSPDGSNELPHHFRHYACMPITISPSDPFFKEFRQGCMNFVRSVLAPSHDCTLGYAHQMNKVTHFIDGSSVYGSSVEQTEALRLFKGGRMKVFSDFGRDLLPLTKDPNACLTTEDGSACFESGDTRTNQLISLVAVHTIFLREHNRIAKELEKLNPHWTDDILFQEARRILIAELQVITYKEFLPAILGEKTVRDFQININPTKTYSYSYNPRVNPSVTNEFTAAAFRFGHSTVDGVLKVYSKTKLEEYISISETMFQPSRMRKRQFLDEILSALTTEPIQEVDNSISDQMTQYLFHGGDPFGVDIASINIQRGRDHGLRSYNDYRVLTGQNKIHKFEEFGEELSQKLRSVYASVDDIDLWIGGLLEPKAYGSIMGKTFRDIIADQFHRLKVGDKYFFDNDPSTNPGFFTEEQLQELKKVTMSRLICDNSDRILLVRQALNAFKQPGVPGNEFYDCSSPGIPHLNLLFWKEYK